MPHDDVRLYANGAKSRATFSCCPLLRSSVHFCLQAYNAATTAPSHMSATNPKKTFHIVFSSSAYLAN